MDYDVIVIGVGAMGAAALEQLSRRGVRVLGVEQFSVPNAEGSSGGDTRLIRKAYFEHPDYVPLLEHAYRGWRELENRSAVRLLYQTGALYIGPPEGDLIAGSARAARQHGLALQSLTAAEVERDYPQFRLPPDHVAAFEPVAGLVLSSGSIAALANLARTQGADLLTHTRVESWHASGNGLLVVTSAGTHRAERLVITAGSWNGRLLAMNGLALRVTRQPVFWIASRQPQFELGRFPCWAMELSGTEGLLYGMPGAVPGVTHAGVKLAHHHPGQSCPPDVPRAAATHAEYQTLRAALAPVIPGLEGTLEGSITCMYTMSNDQHFIVDQHPDHPNVIFAAGFSGHGFKFVPVLGELLADYALQVKTDLPGGFLRMGSRDLWRQAELPR